ncbi:MAG: hypothetical protein AAF730_04560 [Bacteroidota bacterium]
MTPFLARARTLLIATFAVYAVLVAPHEGEFWPFSIYPMFSQAGRTWTRALVRDVTELPPSVLSWAPVPLDDLPGAAFGMQAAGIGQNDISTFIEKTKTWDATRVTTLRRFFLDDDDPHRVLMLYRAQGRIVDGDSVGILLTPFLMMTPDSTRFNPTLTLHTP